METLSAKENKFLTQTILRQVLANLNGAPFIIERTEFII